MDKFVSAYVWTDKIIRDHVQRDILEMTQLVVLSPLACLAFKGKRLVGEGLTGEQAREIIRRLAGHRMVAGTEAMINAFLIMFGKAQHVLVKVRGLIRMQRLQKLTAPNPIADPMTMTKKPLKPMTMKTPKPQNGKVHQADKYCAKQLEKGYGQHTHTEWLIDKRLESLTHLPLLDPPYLFGKKLIMSLMNQCWSPRVH